jgi:hypothetical protein
MRFYTKTHSYSCGIDLHAKTMYLCILDRDGQIVLHKNMRSRPEDFLAAIEPYREDLVVAVECIFTWYCLADLCRKEQIEFVLGHALYMKTIHGGKAKNDKIDAFKIATLLRGGNLPKAYVYPPDMRATRSPGLPPIEIGSRHWQDPRSDDPLRDQRHPSLRTSPRLSFLFEAREVRTQLGG